MNDSSPPSSLRISDITLRFPYDANRGRIGLEFFPTSLEAQTVPRQGGLPHIDALVQIKLVGDPYPGAFAQGHTMRNSPSIARFRFTGQNVTSDEKGHVCLTRLSDGHGLELLHRIHWRDGDSFFTVSSEIRNNSASAVQIEMLSAFSFGSITPFDPADAPGRLRVHRFRSVWSAEGRLDTQTIEQLHLERSWSGAGAFSERFGQVGTMPVRRWFPFAAIEDTGTGVLWGAQLAWAGSWQMEVFRQHDDVCLSGGVADREFGHWLKRLAPGESLETPTATLSCMQGTLDDLCDRLTSAQTTAAEKAPAVEQDLPIIFNEWCTTWGDPTQEKVLAIARRLKGTPVRYLVIDAGWYKTGASDWSSGHGDWEPSATLFPGGLARTADLIREEGLIPGLWYEMETVGEQSEAFKRGEHFLQRDGQPVTVRERRFWDLNDPAAIDYLTTKVIDLLGRCGFGYLKVDYNETAGLGCENGGAESLGEGLRRQVFGTYRFFDKIREHLPHLVIENCASGGHRLEPSMLARTAMSSFSDAHELVEIPLIAANLHRLMLPRQSQIWAVLHPTDSKQRLVYSLAATFLGRMCLSGDIVGLNAAQWEIVTRAMQLYRLAAPIIKEGTSRSFHHMGESWRHPTGWQATRRVNAGGAKALIVWHAFANTPREFSVPLPEGNWRITESFLPAGISTGMQNDRLIVSNAQDFSGGVCFLERED